MNWTKVQIEDYDTWPGASEGFDIYITDENGEVHFGEMLNMIRKDGHLYARIRKEPLSSYLIRIVAWMVIETPEPYQEAQ